jgi:hypothetical protein
MVGGMTAQPAMPGPGEPYQVIRLGGQEAAIVPRRLGFESCHPDW